MQPAHPWAHEPLVAQRVAEQPQRQPTRASDAWPVASLLDAADSASSALGVASSLTSSGPGDTTQAAASNGRARPSSAGDASFHNERIFVSPNSRRRAVGDIPGEPSD
jgi:hypothetical protein